MDVLLDTHVAVWWADDPSVLYPEAIAAIADPANTVWFTSASAWELAIKVRVGKLSIDVAKLVDQLTRNGIRLLGIGVDDAIAAGALEWAHRDPFDRMIVAQPRRQGLRVRREISSYDTNPEFRSRCGRTTSRRHSRQTITNGALVLMPATDLEYVVIGYRAG